MNRFVVSLCDPTVVLHVKSTGCGRMTTEFLVVECCPVLTEWLFTGCYTQLCTVCFAALMQPSFYTPRHLSVPRHDQCAVFATISRWCFLHGCHGCHPRGSRQPGCNRPSWRSTHPCPSPGLHGCHSLCPVPHSPSGCHHDSNRHCHCHQRFNSGSLHGHWQRRWCWWVRWQRGS